eukprot:3204890-Prymnesium_polylepis.1
MARGETASTRPGPPPRPPTPHAGDPPPERPGPHRPPRAANRVLPPSGLTAALPPDSRLERYFAIGLGAPKAVDATARINENPQSRAGREILGARNRDKFMVAADAT